MNPSDSLMSIQPQADCQVVTFARDIHNQEAIDQALATLRQLIDQQDKPRVVFDFSHLRNVGSSFLGMVMAGSMQATRKGGQVRVCNMTPQVKDLFALTRLDRIVPIHDTLDGAIASLA